MSRAYIERTLICCCLIFRTFSSACMDSIRKCFRRVLSIPFGIVFVAYKRAPWAPKGHRGPKGPRARSARPPVRARSARPPVRRPLPPLGPLGPILWVPWSPPTQGVSIRMALGGQGARVQGTYKYGACKWVGGHARSVKNPPTVGVSKQLLGGGFLPPPPLRSGSLAAKV